MCINSQEKTAIQDPHERVQPPLRRVAPDGGPAQHKVQLKASPGHQSAEEHEDKSDSIVQRLQSGDLGEDLERREFCQGAGARWSSSSGHLDLCVCMSVGVRTTVVSARQALVEVRRQ